MNSSGYNEFKLTRVKDLTHDTKEFVYQILPDEANPNPKLPIYPCTSCVRVKTPLGDVIRPYTPTKQDEQSLYFIIKVYPKGQLTQYLASQKIGDKILIQGPLDKIKYVPNKWSHVGMICGGTGITPMWQVIDFILSNPEDKTEISLLYSSKTEEDIILRKELESKAQKHPNFKCHLVVSTPSQAWNGISGRIQKGMISHYIQPPSPQGLVLLCGPDPMINDLAGPKGPNYTQGPVQGVLKELGYNEECVYKF